MISVMLEVLKVLVPLLVGLFAGWVATRNARKTPHDNLKALVDINSSLADGMDPDRIVETAMRRELRRLDRINRSREGSFPHFVWVQIQNNGAATLTAIALVSAVAAGLTELIPQWISAEGKGLWDAAGITIAFAVSTAGAIAGAYRAFTSDRVNAAEDAGKSGE
jgi:hypothetical protein